VWYPAIWTETQGWMQLNGDWAKGNSIVEFMTNAAMMEKSDFERAFGEELPPYPEEFRTWPGIAKTKTELGEYPHSKLGPIPPSHFDNDPAPPDESDTAPGSIYDNLKKAEAQKKKGIEERDKKR
jgi:hypothetical protein